MLNSIGRALFLENGQRRTGLLFLALVLAGTGCWPFEPRTAEPPLNVNPPPTAWTPEETPGVLQSVYNQPLPAQSLDYILMPEFRFHSDPTDAAGAWEWNRDTEIQITATILARFGDLVLQFDTTNVKDPDPSQDSVWISRQYRLSAADSMGVTEYAGRAEFMAVRKATGAWMIRHWYDHDMKADSFPTWGQLKIRHRSGL